MRAVNLLLLARLGLGAGSLTTNYRRNALAPLQGSCKDTILFELGNVTYLAHTQFPMATVGWTSDHTPEETDFLLTVISTNVTTITGRILQDRVANYLANDDVFTQDMLGAVIIASTVPTAMMDNSAIDYLGSLQARHIFLTAENSSGHHGYHAIHPLANTTLIPGPYLARLDGNMLNLSKIYRLYVDSYRDFLYGAYELNDGSDTHITLDVSSPGFGYPLIPVPSRIYSWTDQRPLAGYRVAIKDLYDIKGLKTSGGSQAYQQIVEPASTTAPAIQRLVDLGAVLVGKYKLAQFASGANPWEWQDEYYPMNPRGDGWLACSASSSGGGCSIAAYEWLDYAIGTDTGASMRRPASVSGTYGQRPSQGMITLDGVLPVGYATDTAGVFCRDPYDWIRFSKIWYAPPLHQSSNITGLSALSVPDTDSFPKTILYPVDYLPLDNPDAQAILDTFITNMSSIFGMTVKHFNFTATVQNASDRSVSNLTYLNAGPLNVINRRSSWESFARRFVTTWAQLFDGRFPPIDLTRRETWANYNESDNTVAIYDQALREKGHAVEWYEANLQYSKPESCSESVLIYDIGTGGRPFFREQDLNNRPGAYYLISKPARAEVPGESICPLYGCADFTVPIGQVPYFSPVTFREEMMPVTVNLVVKRGCDFVLYNMIEKLADAGVLKAVKTGREAF